MSLARPTKPWVYTEARSILPSPFSVGSCSSSPGHLGVLRSALLGARDLCSGLFHELNLNLEQVSPVSLAQFPELYKEGSSSEKRKEELGDK